MYCSIEGFSSEKKGGERKEKEREKKKNRKVFQVFCLYEENGLLVGPPLNSCSLSFSS